jgi:D-glycero-D-manno-heptose 1,7-bisphosphate phosphatase
MRAVFFDRDGTLMEDAHYCADPALVHVFPGVPEALRRLRAAGFATFIVTNQSGIGRGLITEEQYQAVHEELLRQLGAGLVDRTYCCPDAPGCCPDAPGGISPRRKPAPGMLLEAAADYAIDLAQSWVVGDKCADIECGRRAGAHTILVLTGRGRQQQSCQPDITCRDVVEATDWIAGHPSK